MSAGPAALCKSVHLIPRDSAVKRLCFDETTRSLRPNLVLVDRDGSVLFEINELGLKGAARDPARKLAVVWGDSVVFGIGWSWPSLIDGLAPGYQFLNGGIEADPYDNILRRAVAFNAEHQVALNVVLLGWHPIPRGSAPKPGRARVWDRLYERVAGRPIVRPEPPPADTADLAARARRFRDELARTLAKIPNLVLATMPTALNPGVAEQDLSAYFRAGGRDTAFGFAGDVAYSVALQRFLFQYITQRNDSVREAARLQGIRLIDLAAAFDTSGKADFRDEFHDVLHLRPSAYAKTASVVYEAVKTLL